MSNYLNFGAEWYTINELWLISMLATALTVILLTYLCSNYFNKRNTHHNYNRNNENNNKCSNENENKSWVNGLFKFKNSLLYAICQRLKIVKQCNNILPNGVHDRECKTFAASETYAEDVDAGSLDDAMDDDCDRIHIEGLVGKLKVQKLKQIKSQFTKCQLEEEKRIESEQLAAIFELLKQQELALNVKEIDKNQLNAQLRLYR